MNIREQGKQFGQKMKNADKISAIMFVLEAQKENSMLDSTTVLENAEVFPAWDTDITGYAGEIYTEGTGVYKMKNDIPKPSATKPSADKTNWVFIGDTTAIFSEWSKPLSIKDAYQRGDRATFNGVRYVSEIDENIYEPDVHGWKISQ